MFTLPPQIKLYEYAGVLVILLLYGAGCAYKGYSYEHTKLITVTAKYEQAAADQNKRTKEEEAQHDAQTLEVANAYSNEDTRLHAIIDKLRQSKNSFSRLPQDASSYQKDDGAKQEQSSAPICTQEFVVHALEDVQKLNAWQDWAKRMNIPVVGE